MILFETSSLGSKFSMTRFVVNIFGVIAIAYIVNKSLSEDEIESIYENANNL